MIKHGTRRTKIRIYIVVSILLIAFLVFDKMRESHKKETEASSVAAKEQIKSMPQWKLYDLKGNLFNSEFLKGDIVLITFWSASCKICLSQVPVFKNLQAKYLDKGLKVVGIVLDERENDDIQAFVKGEGINYIVLRGDTKVAKEFGNISEVPELFLVDRNGNVIKYILGNIDETEISSLIEGLL